MTAQPETSPTPAAEPTVWVRLPLGRPFTQADLDEFPELPGLQVELVDGMLLVSPAPSREHQRMVGRLYSQLDSVCPAGLEVLLGPLDVRPTGERTFQPDLMVANSEDFEQRALRKPGLLYVEVRSPSTRLKDETLKRAAYEQAGVTSYWLVDPLEPAMTVLELTDGRYREVAQISGDDTYEAQRPYPVRIALR